jgi:hypothetical protein
MARSRKRTPISGVTAADSEKDDKRLWHRKMRRKTKHALAADKEPPVVNEVSNPWDMGKEGNHINPIGRRGAGSEPARHRGRCDGTGQNTAVMISGARAGWPE